MTVLLITDAHDQQHNPNKPECLPSSGKGNLLVFLVWSFPPRGRILSFLELCCRLVWYRGNTEYAGFLYRG